MNIVLLLEKTYAHQKIRTDSKEQTLHSFVVPKELNNSQSDNASSSKSVGTSCKKRKSTDSPQLTNAKKRKHHKPIHLTSVNNLIQEVKDKEHQGLFYVLF